MEYTFSSLQALDLHGTSMLVDVEYEVNWCRYRSLGVSILG